MSRSPGLLRCARNDGAGCTDRSVTPRRMIGSDAEFTLAGQSVDRSELLLTIPAHDFPGEHPHLPALGGDRKLLGRRPLAAAVTVGGELPDPDPGGASRLPPAHPDDAAHEPHGGR